MTRSRLASATLALTAVALGAYFAYALRRASAFQDDYVYIAVARHLDSPWVLLTQDSIGSYFFRPMGMLLWWASAAVLDESAPAHHALGMALHVANGLLLHALLRRLQVRATVAALVCLGFIAHPAAVSTAVWLSDRFDLLATTWGLLALIAVDRHLERPTWVRLGLAAAAMGASILSKEIGFAVAATGMLAALWTAGGRHAATPRWRWALVAALAAVVAAALMARTLALRPVPDTEGVLRALVGVVASGTWKWILGLPGFLFVQEGRLAALAAWILTFAFLAIGAARVASLRPLTGGALPRLAGLGVALMLLTAAAQSPILAHTPLSFYSREGFNSAAMVSARFYYLPLAGFALVVAALAESIARAADKRPAVVLVALAACTLVGFTVTSRAIARHWSQFTQERAGLHARPAIEAVSALRNLAPGCKIYLLDTPPDADLFRDMADTGVKKSLPRGHPAMGCFIQAEHAPWYHLLARAGLPPGAERPFEIIEAGGRPFPPLEVGNLIYYFVRATPGDAALDDPHATFLALRDGRYVDVTEEVRIRKRMPKLYDRRAP